jgi:A/G-specific adenine glycosylase
MEKWFAKAILGWYSQNKRDLPWRHETDAYKIWLSEIILQQTQVIQGLRYYLNFEKKYPTIKHLAKAPEDEVLKLWQGLGYYSRARNLHATAKTVVADYKGVFPSSYNQIKDLKGVGDYTAAAISSFAFNLPHAVVDGNVYRLLSRVFGIETPIDSSKAKKEFQALASELLDKQNPATHNQAIMEFGSQYCKPVNPDCENCVLKNKCFAFKTQTVALLPIKHKKTKVRKRYFNYIVVSDKTQEIIIKKRPKGDIWQGLYEFNLIETKKEVSREALFLLQEFKELTASTFTLKHVSKQYKHILSHQHLYATFYVLSLNKNLSSCFTEIPGNKGLLTTSLKKLNLYAFSRLTEKFMDDCEFKEIL